MKKRLIVLGSTGFVGKAVCLNPSFKAKFKIYGYNSKNFNLNFYKKIKSTLINKIKNSILIFAAGKHRIYGDSKKLQKYNEKILSNLFKILIQNKPKKIIFLSTVEVYGKPKKNENICEKSKLKPINNYSKGKINIEKKITYMAKAHKFNYLILRLPGIFGNKDKNISIVSKLYNSFYKEKFYLNGSGNQKRNYLYINDLLKVLFKLSTNSIKNTTLNVVSNKSYSLNQIIKFLENNIKKSPRIIYKKSTNQYDLNFNNSILKKKNLSKYIGVLPDNIRDYCQKRNPYKN